MDFKHKYVNSLKAAKLLIDSDLPNESVHCSYYAVLQFCKYFILETTSTTTEQLDSDSKGENSHKKIFELMQPVIQVKDFSFWLKFNKTFYELKEARKTADYEMLSIDKNIATSRYGDAVYLINTLSKYLI